MGDGDGGGEVWIDGEGGKDVVEKGEGGREREGGVRG